MRLGPNWVLSFLAWWEKNDNFVLFGVSYSCIFFVLIFGNYSSWISSRQHKEFSDYFSHNDINIKLNFLSDLDSVIKFTFSYADGTSFDYSNSQRLNKNELVQFYKEKLLEKVCDHSELRNRLKSGQRVEIDLRDADWPWGISQLFNMSINYDRCY